ncbi:hypothetical protein RI845_06380 [Thalassotalea nanhaiensis]|uniref:TerB family tellurite resistance protein n=1 Tax=Thalassotalea nanhaiensis TaxID=3065648 RepID=A0ABY9TPV4_9GAMM|nr:hypothetical protein RI845_06380 [Colwelliaceae bacterium SQ345]
MIKIFTFLAILLSFSALTKEECVTEDKLNTLLNSGQLDLLLKPKFTFEKSLEEMDFLSVIRDSLNVNDESQLLLIETIDLTIDSEINLIILSIQSGIINKELKNHKKYINRVIKAIEGSREKYPSNNGSTSLEKFKYLVEMVEV